MWNLLQPLNPKHLRHKQLRLLQHPRNKFHVASVTLLHSHRSLKFLRMFAACLRLGWRTLPTFAPKTPPIPPEIPGIGSEKMCKIPQSQPQRIRHRHPEERAKITRAQGLPLTKAFLAKRTSWRCTMPGRTTNQVSRDFP